MNKKPKEEFKGIFMPAKIMYMQEISFLEKYLLSFIDDLYDKNYDGSNASNYYLANILGVKENTIAKTLTHLRKINLIEVSFDRGTRVIRSKVNEFIAKGQPKEAKEEFKKMFLNEGEIDD